MSTAEWIDEYGVSYSLDRKKLLRIPKHIVAYCVTEGTEIIGDSAAHSNDKLEWLSLPSTIKIIERVAFYGCRNLQEIHLPDSLLHIGFGGFMGCHSLEEVMLPSNVNFMDGNPFANCSSLINIEIVDSINYVSEDGILYNAAKDTIICYPAG